MWICRILHGKNSWNHLVWTYFLAGFRHLEPLCAVVCSSLPVLAWIHALALQPKLQAEGHTGLYSFVRHRTTCRKTTNIWTATLELTVWSYWLAASFLFELRIMFYVLTGQNYCQELKWLLLYNIKQGNYKVPTVFLRLKRLSYEGKNNCYFFDLLQFLWKCCPKIIFNSIYLLLV